MASCRACEPGEKMRKYLLAAISLQRQFLRLRVSGIAARHEAAAGRARRTRAAESASSGGTAREIQYV